MLENILKYLEFFYVPKLGFLDILEILGIVILVYQLQKNLRNTRAWVIIKGIIILAIIYLISALLGLNVIKTIFQASISLSVIAIIILFQTEIKKLLEELGTYKIKDFLKNIKLKPIVNKRYSDESIKEILEACSTMSDAKTGALIIIEQDSILNDYINTGIAVNADISSQLLLNIFEHNTPLHDGAIIIRKNKILAATCYLPLSDNRRINKKLGTRHRAGIGLSEVTDAIVIIVSEETGKISFVKDGKIQHGISIETLHNLLNNYQNLSINDNKKDLIKQKRINIKNNWLQIILSTVFALFLWIGIINIQDPLINKSFNIPVTIQNEKTLSDVGKTYEIISNETVSVQVTAARSIIENLTIEDFMAIADFQKLSYTYAVPIDVIIPKLKATEYEIEMKDNTLQLQLDELAELQTDIQIDTVGKCANGYYLTNLTTNTPSITIKGGKSIIDTINYAKIEVDITDKSSDFTETDKVILYDKNGNVMKLDNLDLSRSEIITNGTVLPTKKVPINVNILNTNTDIYQLKSYDLDLDNVLIATDSEDLENINEINIEIDLAKEDLNKSNLTESYIKTINLSEYLPENVKLATESNKLNITMVFDIYETKTFTLQTENIKIVNLNKDLNCKFKEDEIILNFKGLKTNLNNIDFNSLNYELDVKSLNKGSYSLTLKIVDLPEHITLVSDGIISISLERK